jgi:hypothetical protein
MRWTKRKIGHAVGRASRESFVLGHPDAKFSAGNEGQAQKKRKNWTTKTKPRFVGLEL